MKRVFLFFVVVLGIFSAGAMVVGGRHAVWSTVISTSILDPSPELSQDEVEEWVVDYLAPKYHRVNESEAAYRRRFRELFGNDYLAAFSKETGKVAVDGKRLRVWHDYVVGTDPTNPDSQFRATITMGNGTPIVSWMPKLEPEQVAQRKYTVFGKMDIVDTKWIEVPVGLEGNYHFFKVTVEMRKNGQ